MNERTDIRVCKMYSVYMHYERLEDGRRVPVWSPDGRKSARDFGRTISSFAVRVLGLARDGVALGADGQGHLHEVPLCAFGERIPDTSFLPGDAVIIRGRGMYTIEKSDDGEPTSAEREVHLIRHDALRGGGRCLRLVRYPDGWFLGTPEKRKPVRVVYRGVELQGGAS